MRWECVIFDLDGTLVDSEILNFQAYAELLPEITESQASLIKRYEGMQLAAVVSDIEARYKLSLPEDFEDTFREHIRGLFERGLKPIPGIPELLPSLAQRKCVASNAPQRKLAHALEVVSLTEHFDGNVFSAYDIAAWKPKPDLFLHAADKMGFKPEQCAIIEDSPTGVEAALAAGIQVFHYTPKKMQRESKAGYQSILHMSELSDILTA
ncbi:HAD-IA family hydrolase [Leucothrix pacifica]|uniref:Haloacid dehalogenase n=1 Tax=Leucothrix pacifica TaxID=1247513 RepID=A0A317CDX0_9GAMM|nr:HAD-IA family hydrolase [Leucothrix pacifica]PWQ96854.1 haloacid dehalogenase [Leucothrix pacifica]